MRSTKRKCVSACGDCRRQKASGSFSSCFRATARQWEKERERKSERWKRATTTSEEQQRRCVTSDGDRCNWLEPGCFGCCQLSSSSFFAKARHFENNSDYLNMWLSSSQGDKQRHFLQNHVLILFSFFLFNCQFSLLTVAGRLFPWPFFYCFKAIDDFKSSQPEHTSKCIDTFKCARR